MLQLAQPDLNKIKSGSSSSPRSEAMFGAESFEEKDKHIEDVAHYYRRRQISPQMQALNTFPFLSVFSLEPFYYESGTTKADFEFRWLPPPESHTTRLARQQLKAITDRTIAREAEKLIDGLYHALENIDASHFPPLRIFEAEDGSLSIEWMLPHHRLGFSIEPDEQESSWFLVSDRHAQSIQAFGLLFGEDVSRLTAWLVNSLIDYYRK